MGTDGSSLGFLSVQSFKPSPWIPSLLPVEGLATMSPIKAFVPLQLQTDDEKMSNSMLGCQKQDEKSPYSSVC